MKGPRHRIHAVAVTLILTLLLAPAAAAQVQIKVNDDTFFKLGLLLQTQADALQDPATGGYAQNVFVRRVRFLVGGQIAKNVSFFIETDSPNLGKSMSTGTKNNQPSLYLQDAYVELKVNDKLAIDAGLMLPSVSRNGLQSAATLLPIDYGAYTFAFNSATQGNVGRDTGVQAKGYFLGKKLEYRAGVFQGMRDQQDRELRFIGRVQYNFLEPETGFFYTGTYLGKKKVLAVGAGIDRQHQYEGYAFDVFFDYPVKGGALTTQLDHIRYDGGNFLRSLPDQKITHFEAGYLIGKTRFMPVVSVTSCDYTDASRWDEVRYAAGLNYFLSGHNTNVKALYQRIDRDQTREVSQFTIQIQFFYF